MSLHFTGDLTKFGNIPRVTQFISLGNLASTSDHVTITLMAHLVFKMLKRGKSDPGTHISLYPLNVRG